MVNKKNKLSKAEKDKLDKVIKEFGGHGFYTAAAEVMGVNYQTVSRIHKSGCGRLRTINLLREKVLNPQNAA